MSAGRNGRSYRERKNADALKAQRLQPCRRCAMSIDYSAPPEHPDSFNAGHIKSWIDNPNMREDPSNLRPEHAKCNKSAGANIDLDLGQTSRRW